MIARAKRAVAALVCTVEFWIIYGLFLLACALERDEPDPFDHRSEP